MFKNKFSKVFLLVTGILFFGLGELKAATLDVDCTGGTATYSTLQDAIDASANGDTIELQSDCSESVEIEKDLTLDGNNYALTGTSTTGPAILVSGGHEVTISNFVLTPQTGESCIVAGSDGNTLTVTYVTCSGTGSYGIYFDFSQGGELFVKNSTFDSTYSGIHINALSHPGSDNLKVNIKNNLFLHNTYGVHFQGSGVQNGLIHADITDNTFDHNQYGLAADGTLTIIGKSKVNSNTFSSNKIGIAFDSNYVSWNVEENNFSSNKENIRITH